MGLHRTLQLGNFLHHLLVDGDTTCGIHYHHVVVILFGIGDGIFCNRYRIVATVFAVDFHAHLFAQYFQLLSGGRTVNVTSNKQGISAQTFQVFSQLSSESGLTRTLKTGD